MATIPSKQVNRCYSLIMKTVAFGNRNFSVIEIIIWVAVLGGMIAGVVYFLSTPAKVDTICTKEYVAQYGSKECEAQTKADDESTSERVNDMYN